MTEPTPQPASTAEPAAKSPTPLSKPSTWIAAACGLAVGIAATAGAYAAVRRHPADMNAVLSACEHRKGGAMATYDDGRSLYFRRIDDEDNKGKMLRCVADQLDMPDSTVLKMTTISGNGMHEDSWDGYKVTWRYAHDEDDWFNVLHFVVEPR